MIVKPSVSDRDDTTPPDKKVKLRVSPSTLAYVVIWNSDLPEYGPNGGVDGVSCSPRTCVLISAVSVPDD